jgi:hypothetical protein
MLLLAPNHTLGRHGCKVVEEWEEISGRLGRVPEAGTKDKPQPSMQGLYREEDRNITCR